MTYLTPPRLAKQMGVSPVTVRGWIESGELRAINISGNPDRPRWRIRIDDADAFERSKESAPAANLAH